MNGSEAPQAESRIFVPAYSLARREITRFLRQRGRIIGAVGTPLIFWLLFGGGIGSSFKVEQLGESYLEYSYPGAIASILLFTAIFSMISIIDDRSEGFMQGVLVAPVSRVAIVVGKVAGASVLAVGQAAVFLLLAPVAGLRLGPLEIAATFGAMVLVSVAVCGLGFWMAWRMESTQGFHAVMNVVLMPMLALSGAFFPMSGASMAIVWLMRLNPMTYGVSLIRSALLGKSVDEATGLSAVTGLAVTVGFMLIMVGVSIRAASRETRHALA
ncbi:MAG: ABC transporter permease [Phycisphaerales bacterium]|nr:ABC transporter permease [Phycisphaerales bacterium]MCB9854275.1 ABC transporter permease [Phycisphaerales bacterium]